MEESEQTLTFLVCSNDVQEDGSRVVDLLLSQQSRLRIMEAKSTKKERQEQAGVHFVDVRAVECSNNERDCPRFHY